ncbi:MAG TPA: murein biosynthesis integral membrane protein MurJ [Bryobacteraceae bacterium]|nr:murein biosynthesis integral membrane protein MurJ [Bryobacteraceae bacterium]
MNNTGNEVTRPEPAPSSEQLGDSRGEPLSRASSSAQAERLVRSAGVVSLSVFTSRITGLLRESIMARLFGAGLVYDAFMLGFRIPNLTRDLFAEGALSSAFVPTFTEYLTTRGKEEAARLANLVATALMIIVGSICAAGTMFAPALVRLFAPGYAAVPGKFELAVTMTRIMFPFLLLVALAAQAMGILNASNRFGVPAMASTFFNIGSVGFGIVLGVLLGPALRLSRIEGMAVGVVLGGALQLFWQLPSLHRLGYRFRPAFGWSDSGVVKILKMMAPAILGNAAVQINVLVNTNFASTIYDPHRGFDGPVSWLSYAFRFMQLPLGLFGVAMASATLPSISRSAAQGNMEEFRRTLSHSLAMVFLLTLPSSLGLIVLGKSIIGAIYQGGRFQVYDTQQTALALSCYSIGLMGYAALKVLTPAYYALGDARTPMLVSLASILVNYSVASTMIRVAGLRHAGLALSTSAVALSGFALLFMILRKRLGGIYGRALLTQVFRVGVASAAMAAVVALSSRAMENRLGVSQLARLADLAVSIPLGVAVYYGACRWLRIGDIDLAIRAFAAPVRRRLAARRPMT